MPLKLKLTPKKPGMTPESKEVVDLVDAIRTIPGLFFHNLRTERTSTISTNEIKEVVFTFYGITVVSREASNMLDAIVQKKLEECDSPFYLSCTTSQTIPGYDEAVFLHEAFKPIKSRNSRDLAHVKDLDIPQKFCCHLSGDIMDHPVYDIRSPETMYDFDFLMYWLNKSEPKYMPHTKLLFDKFFLTTNYVLKIQITSYVYSIIDAADAQAQHAVLTEYGARLTSGKAEINQALLRLAQQANSSNKWLSDFKALLRAGADINCQDDNPASRCTPLHYVIKSGVHEYIIQLLYNGAAIHIRNAYYLTAFDMIFRSTDDQAKSQLIFICQQLKLISISPQQAISLSHKIKETAVDNPQKLAELLKTKYNQASVSMPAIAKALRNACAQNNHEDLPLLLSSGVSVDTVAEDSLNKRTALHWAVIKESEECVRFLLEAGARDDIKDNAKTAKEYASESSHRGIKALFGLVKDNALAVRPK